MTIYHELEITIRYIPLQDFPHLCRFTVRYGKEFHRETTRISHVCTVKFKNEIHIRRLKRV